MSDTTKCPRCRRMVRFDYPYFPYCYNHRANSSPYKDIADSESDISFRNVPSTAVTPHESLSHTISVHTKLDGPTAYAIALAVDDLSKSRDLTVPDNAREVSARSFAQSMIENGVEPERIGFIKLQGLNRFSFDTGKVQEAPNFVREIIVVDPYTSSETVIDPSMADLAPVWDQDQPVESTLISGETPYADVPWIGSAEDYLDSAYVWWNQSDRTT